MTRLLVSVLLLVSFSALAGPATAARAAAGETVELPVKMDWEIGFNGTSTCASWGLATWQAQKGAIAWELRYHFSPPDPAYAGERTKTLSPPFDDDEFVKFGWRPGAGMHWDGLSYSGRSSVIGNPVTCGDLQAKQKTYYSNVRIAITLEADAKIVGKVRAPNGDPLAGVRVRAAGAGGDRTDARGQYEIDVPEKAKRYAVRASKRDVSFRPKVRRVAVRPGKRSHANFRAAGYVIQGTLTERCPDASASRDSQAPRCTTGVGAAKVSAQKADGKVYKVRTKPDGTYVMLVREKGGYVIKFSVDGRTWVERKRVKRRNVVVNKDIGNRNTGGFIRR